MKNIIAASILALSTVAAGSALANNTTQPYIWTNGEAGLIANPNFKGTGGPDFSEGHYLVGVGENGLRANPKFANLPNMEHVALFKAGIGEVSLIEITPAPTLMAASK